MWRIRIEHDDTQLVDYQVPDDELEYGVDDALREARRMSPPVRDDGAQL